MLLKVRKSVTQGAVSVPGSKSHTIRALFIASLAGGLSTIRNPLLSGDAFSGLEICKSFGARFETTEDSFIVNGFGSSPAVPENIVDVGNSGTSLRFAMMTAGLVDGITVFTGDEQIRRRPLGSLISAMNQLG